MNYTIIGAGKSGHAVFLAQDLGQQCFSHRSKDSRTGSGCRQQLAARSIDAEFGGHTDKGLKADIIVVSPGVPPTNSFIQEAEAQDSDYQRN